MLKNSVSSKIWEVVLILSSALFFFLSSPKNIFSLLFKERGRRRREREGEGETETERERETERGRERETERDRDRDKNVRERH